MLARRQGNYFEYYICSSIRAKPFDEYTKKKFITYTDPIIFNLDKILNGRKVKYYQLLDDNKGREGITSDIILHTTRNEHIGLSCKRNNMSIKHPCPSGMHRYLSSDKRGLYMDAYKSLNDKWYKAFMKYEYYNKIPYDRKHHMLNEFVVLVDKYLNSEYIKFLLSYNPGQENYIVCMKDNKDTVNIMRMKRIRAFKFSTDVKNSNIYITLNGIRIKMRLHTASLRITKKLRIKFDTRVLNVDSLYEEL